MGRFEIDANIERFRRMLRAGTLTPAQPETVERFLVEERGRLADLNQLKRQE